MAERREELSYIKGMVHEAVLDALVTPYWVEANPYASQEAQGLRWATGGRQSIAALKRIELHIDKVLSAGEDE